MSRHARDGELVLGSYERGVLRALDAVPARLGPVVRAARTAEGLGLRELARRAGISESQVSRVENAKTLNPSDDTLLGLADALGRPRLALVCLSDSPEAGLLGDLARETLETMPPWVRARHDVDVLESREDLQALRLFARDVFLTQSLSSVLETASLEPAFGPELMELISGWSGLTSERQQSLLQFFRDQQRLSELDRRQDQRGGRAR